MTTLTCSLAVLGDHLGGLAAAALAVRRGRRVVLFETQETEEGRPLEYLNAVAGGPEQETALGRFFQEIGRSPFGPLGDDRIHFRALVPPLQVILERHRLNVYAERTARTWELQREFGEAHRALAPLGERDREFREKLDRLRPEAAASHSLPARALSSVTGFLRLQALEREAVRPGFLEFLRGRDLPAELEAALLLLAQGVSRRSPSALSWSEGLAALRVGQGGVFQNASGQSGVLRGLRELFVSAGGETRPLVALEGLEVPRGGGARLHLAAGTVVRADRVVLDLPLADGLRLLPAELGKSLRKKGIEERTGGEYGLLEFGVLAERRPEGMGKYLVIAPPAAAPDGPGILLAAQPGEVAETGDRYGLEAIAFFPPGAAAAGRAAMLEQIRGVMPFLDESLAGEVAYRTGGAPRYTREQMGRAQREGRLGSWWRTALFAHPPLVFLRNEDYATTGLAEGIVSGALAVEE
jgi:hypothetical protein